VGTNSLSASKRIFRRGLRPGSTDDIRIQNGSKSDPMAQRRDTPDGLSRRLHWGYPNSPYKEVPSDAAAFDDQFSSDRVVSLSGWSVRPVCADIDHDGR